MKKYYKTNDKSVVGAWREFLSKRESVMSEANKFAESIGAKALVTGGTHYVEFFGVTFNGEEPFMGRGLWSKPEWKNEGRQFPIKKVPASLKEESKKLRQIWSDGIPKIKAEKEPLYASLGLNLGDLIFGGGFRFFEIGGTAYLATAATSKKADILTEITGSEFENAKSIFDAGQKK